MGVGFCSVCNSLLDLWFDTIDTIAEIKSFDYAVTLRVGFWDQQQKEQQQHQKQEQQKQQEQKYLSNHQPNFDQTLKVGFMVQQH